MVEHDLRRALRRREPPVGFAPRTLVRIRDNRASHPDPAAGARRPSVTVWWIAAGVAASVLLAVGAAEFKSYQREADAQRAAQDLTLALRITSEKLHDVEVQVFATSQRGENRHDDQPSR